MTDIQEVRGYYHAAYIIAAVAYSAYILMLARRARRAMSQIEAPKSDS